jgi:type III secretion protein Q
METRTAPSVTEIPKLLWHPRLPSVGSDLAAATRVLYGREWTALAVGNESFSVLFNELQPAHVALQLSLRCAGCDFEVQVLDPAALSNLSQALSIHVPMGLQKSAVLHALHPLWHALETRLAAPLELREVSTETKAWPCGQALGITVVRHSPDTPPFRSGLMLRALQSSGWQRLVRATGLSQAQPSAAQSAPLVVSVRGESVPLTPAELAQLEPGDVLLLKAPAASRDRLDVSLHTLGHGLSGVVAVLQGRRLSIVRCTGVPPDRATAVPHTTRRTERRTMVSASSKPDADVKGANLQLSDLDRLQIDVEVELGRLSMPISALRSLSVGQVFETEAAADGCSVWLWCGGQCLGVGQLVAVGERLGVRIAALESGPAAS